MLAAQVAVVVVAVWAVVCGLILAVVKARRARERKRDMARIRAALYAEPNALWGVVRALRPIQHNPRACQRVLEAVTDRFVDEPRERAEAEAEATREAEARAERHGWKKGDPSPWGPSH